MSKPIIRKHSAKCVQFLNNGGGHGTGDIMHYVLIGGRWYYNGRSGLECNASAKDGFWNDPVKEILERGSLPTSLGDFKKAFKATNFKIYIREWESVREPLQYQTGAPF